MDKTVFIAGRQGGKVARMVSELLQGLVERDKRIADLVAQLAAERHLLVRYMAGVIDAEGESYIKNCRGYVVEFTEGEKAALRAVEPLAIAEMNK
jgi:hypothetical protein